jgi:tRNA threonylcarbamoyladenosine biosynthesis protein TsaE
MELRDAAATEKLGRDLVTLLPEDPGGWMILLQGELGTGKTTLARSMLRALGHEGVVPSPTYTLVEPYRIDDRTVYHVDLYRIADASELEFLGWSDLRDGLLLVEWPDRVDGLAGQGDLLVELSYSGNGRSAEITGLSERGRELCEKRGRTANSNKGSNR